MKSVLTGDMAITATMTTTVMIMRGMGGRRKEGEVVITPVGGQVDDRAIGRTSFTVYELINWNVDRNIGELL